PQPAPQAAPQYTPQPPMAMPPKKKSTAPILIGCIAAFLVILAVCFFTVHIWKDATCSSPRTCALCGKTEGQKLEHDWIAATCKTPETCSLCGETRGSFGHKWEDATCLQPKTCQVCHATQGGALGHDWQDATYDAPMTCSRCGRVQGVPLGYIDTVEGDFQSFIWGSNNTHCYVFDTPVYTCREFLLFFEPIFNYGAWVDEWKLLYQDTKGVWHEYCIFTVDSQNCEYIFTFDPTVDIKAIAVIPRISGSYSYTFSLGVWNMYTYD
ncbi:MAG: hypothetical protein IJA71_10515, partial [Clostridia bacterium]|nr:hypothetical protein [Clostridia bacterium]